MDGIQRIYYGLGQLAYAVALADGKVQNVEKDKLRQIVVEATRHKNLDFNYSDIIFNLLKEMNEDSKMAFELGIANLKSASKYLTPELKELIIDVLGKIAKVYVPETLGERDIIEKIERELKKL